VHPHLLNIKQETGQIDVTLLLLRKKLKDTQLNISRVEPPYRCPRVSFLTVLFISVIRRWHHRDGISIRAIARRTGLSRNTVRQVDPQDPKRKGRNKLDEYSKTQTTPTGYRFKDSTKNKEKKHKNKP